MSTVEETPFVHELGFVYEYERDQLVGSMEITTDMLSPGSELAYLSVPLTAGDILVGRAANEFAPTPLLTTDLTMRMLRPVGVGRLRMESRLTKLGRTLTGGEGIWLDEQGSLVAHCWGTFMASPRAQDANLTFEGGKHPEPVRPSEVTLDRHFLELLGVQLLGPGVAEVVRRPALLQPTGTLQGGVVATLAEEAARSLLAAPVTWMEVRYLGGIRDGKGRATATLLSPTLARVEIVDTERTDRLATVVLAGSVMP